MRDTRHLRDLVKAHAELGKLIAEEELRLRDPAPGAATCGTSDGFPCPFCGQKNTLDRDVYYTGQADEEERCEHCGGLMWAEVACMPIVIVAAKVDGTCAYCGKYKDEDWPGVDDRTACRCLEGTTTKEK